MEKRQYFYWLETDPTPEQAGALREIPGIYIERRRPRAVWASENCAWIAEKLFGTLQMRVRPVKVPPPLPVFKQDCLYDIQNLREFVVGPRGGVVHPRSQSGQRSFLRPFQAEGITYALNRPGSLLNHPAGAGKTLESIIWGLGAPGRIIVLTRASVRRQWVGEVMKFTLEVPQVIEGEKPVKFNDHSRFIILSWEVLPKHAKALADLKATSLIYDEIHYRGASPRRMRMVPVQPGDERPSDVYRDGQMWRFESRDNIAAGAALLSKSVKRIIATSATPVRNRLRDLWAQLDLINPGGWGSFRTFTARYCNGHTDKYGHYNSAGRSLRHMEELRARLTFVVHHVDYAVTHKELPSKRRVVIKVPLDLQSSELTLTKAETLELRKLGQIGEVTARLMEACSRKRRIVCDLVEEATSGGGKVVIFTGRKKDCELWGKAITKLLPEGGKIWVAHGDTPQKERERIRVEYMAAPGPAVLIGTGDAWGEGLNLHDTDAAISAMLPITPSQMVQREGRFARLGQTRPVIIYYPIAEGTIDERYQTLLLDKLPAVEESLGDSEITAMRELLSGKDREEDFIDSILDKIANPVGEFVGGSA